MLIFVDFLNILKAVIEIKNVISNSKHLSSSALHNQESRNINNVIIYSDDSKNENTSNLRAGIFYTKNFAIENSRSLSWNLNSHMKVFDAELFAIEKAFKLALNQISCYTKDI